MAKGFDQYGRESLLSEEVVSEIEVFKAEDGKSLRIVFRYVCSYCGKKGETELKKELT